jgi:hypothetical protein
MRNLLLVLLIVFGANVAIAGNNDPNATQKLKGQVVDESGNTLAGVEVKIEGLEKRAYTDFDGNFEIEGLKRGAYTIVVNLVSYKESKNVLKTVQNEGDVTLIKLTSKQLKLN